MSPHYSPPLLAGLILFCVTGAAAADDLKNSYQSDANKIQVEKLFGGPATSVVGEAIRYPSGDAEITAAVVTLPPGKKTGWHKHGAPLFGYILSGELQVDYGDKGVRTFKAGSGLMEAMNHRHRGINAGTEPVRILVVYMGAEGVKNVIPD
ncbi:MAG: cupin domain-containing protein [Rhodospirillales bacterium]